MPKAKNNQPSSARASAGKPYQTNGSDNVSFRGLKNELQQQGYDSTQASHIVQQNVFFLNIDKFVSQGADDELTNKLSPQSLRKLTRLGVSAMQIAQIQQVHDDNPLQKSTSDSLDSVNVQDENSSSPDFNNNPDEDEPIQYRMSKHYPTIWDELDRLAQQVVEDAKQEEEEQYTIRFGH